jgi:hypothetical protein
LGAPIALFTVGNCVAKISSSKSNPKLSKDTDS